MRGALLLSLSLALAFVAFPIATAAVGVSPSSYSVDFKPGLTEVFPFEFYVDQGAKMEIFAQGDLAEYIELSDDNIEGRGHVNALLKLPDEIETPGTHTIYITARQVVDEENGFGIVGSIKGLIIVKVPYPGQYAIVEMSSTNAKAGEPVNLSVYIQNLGKENVHLRGQVGIYRNETLIQEIDLGEFDLATPESTTILRTLSTRSYLPGSYRAVATVWYGDNNMAQGESSFRLGELAISIVNYTREFERDKINRIEVTVESNWNDPINEVYANITLQGYLMSFLTPSSSVEGFGRATLTGFFDTSGIQNDTFTGIIKVNYAGKSTEELAVFTFKKETDYLLIGLIIAAVVVIGLILFITYVLRKAEKK